MTTYVCRGYGCKTRYQAGTKGSLGKYLCPSCNSIPKDVRQKAAQKRTDLRRGRYKKEDARSQNANVICNSRWEGCDRGDPGKARAYWRERSWHAAQLGVKV